MSMRVGIVGTGWVVPFHVEALKMMEGVQVAAIAGRNTQRAAEVVNGTGAKVYDQWQKMLADEKLDAVMILLPPHLHGELEEACAQCVKGVLIEKPICQKMETAERIERAFARAGTIVSVGYMHRYRPTVDRVRSLLSGPDECIVLVNGQWIGGVPGPMWWRNLEQSGGQFVEQCTHIVDLARYIAGEITQVSSFVTKDYIDELPDYTVNDAQVVNVRFANGAIGNFTTACHARGFGDVGLRLSSRSIQCTLAGGTSKLQVLRDKQPKQEYESNDDVFLIQTRVFMDAVRSGDAALIRSSYADAMRTLRVTLAANESAMTGRPVDLPLTP